MSYTRIESRYIRARREAFLMSKTTCGAPRCKRIARWGLTGPTEIPTPDVLCPHHWHKLRQETPLVAVMYCPIGLREPRPLSAQAVVIADASKDSPDSARRTFPDFPELS